MKKTRLAAVALIVGIVPVLLSGCIGTPAPTKTAAPTTSTTQSAPASPIAVPAPSSTAQLQQQATPAGNSSVAAKYFPNATATEHFTKAQVQQALYSATQFTRRSMNAPTFLSGNWAKTGYRSEDATQFVNFLTPLAYQHMKDLMSGVQQKDSAEADKLFSVLLFLPEGGSNYTVCAADAYTCQDNNYPKLSNYFVGENKAGNSIEITLTSESRVSMTVKGVKGYLPVTNTLNFSMVKNDEYKGGLDAQPFLINGWTTKYVSQSWTK